MANSKNELNELIDKFEIDENKADIEIDLEALKHKLDKNLSQLKKSLIGEKSYSFIYTETSIEDLFGKFEPVNFFSVIILILSKKKLYHIC